MKDKILTKATEMYLSLGFKSVTMDDIATEMGISKKTIYQFYSNKSLLVQDTAIHLFETISNGIDEIITTHKNPIEELYEIKNFMAYHLKDESASPMYQLQKYYPKTHSILHQKQFCKMDECVVDNLQRGIDVGVYRKEIDKEFVARIYFIGINGIRDKDLFPTEKFMNMELIDKYLEYHIRSIATPEGLQLMQKIQNK